MPFPCDHTNVAAQWPLLSEGFSDSPATSPSLSQVNTYIARAKSEMEAAWASGGHYEKALSAWVGDADKWAFETHVLGALMYMYQYLYSFGPEGKTDRIPMQDQFPARLKQLRHGELEWADVGVTPTGAQLLPFRQTFC